MTVAIPIEVSAGGDVSPAKSAWWRFIAVNATALSFAAIVTLQAIRFGLAPESAVILQAVLGLTALIAIPIGAMVAEHTFSLEKLRISLGGTTPTDPLTGLLTARTFERVMDDELNRIGGHRRPAALAMFEIDQFDGFADMYGQGFANEVVTTVAKRAFTELRSPLDYLARWSDSQFLLLLSDVSLMQAHAICDRLRDIVEVSPIDYHGQRAHITLSCGIAALGPDKDTTAALREAADALMEARRFGRNQVRTSDVMTQSHRVYRSERPSFGKRMA